MPRIAIRPRSASVVVRDATADDIPALNELAAEVNVTGVLARRARSSGAGSPRGALISPGGTESTFEDATSAIGNRLLVATVTDRIVALLWLTFGQREVPSADNAIHINQLYVQRTHRRAGVARALLHEVTEIADARDANVVTAWTLPQDREVNRYLARLGFAPLAVRRVASVSSLRRTLAPSGTEPGIGLSQAAAALRRTRRRTV
jgi:GNAT superfamily N-acetyltransferase